MTNDMKNTTATIISIHRWFRVFVLILITTIIIMKPAIVIAAASPSSSLAGSSTTNQHNFYTTTTQRLCTAFAAASFPWSSSRKQPVDSNNNNNNGRVDQDNSARSNNPSNDQEKYITFIRHGCTYMNEYLGGADGGRRFGAPKFTDVFIGQERYSKYHDTRLSPYGLRQVATSLADKAKKPTFLDTCDLIVISPLTRALQTYHLGLHQHVSTSATTPQPKIMAVPAAAERLYLISDVGRTVTELQTEYPYVHFDTNLFPNEHHKWWYQPDDKTATYIEWRPIGKEQNYACPGEPLDAFNHRMNNLYQWLQGRSETNIAVVSHHGVIDWFLDMDFDNCQYHTIAFQNMQPKALMKIII